MRPSGFLAVLSTALFGCAAAKDAPVVIDNPQGVEFKATLPKKPFFTGAALVGNVKGSVSATAGPAGKGVRFRVQFENLPKTGGPFLYHIHEEPAVNGNCTSTLAHLDPYHRGETPACNASAPQTCQVGDLSGKYGKITSDPFVAEYFDLYTSLQPGSPAFFGNRSIVVHYANKTRLTCANFAKLPVSSPTTVHSTAGAHHTAIHGPLATGGAHNTTSHHNSTSPHHTYTASPHHSTGGASPTDVYTLTSVVTVPGSPTTSSSLTTTDAGSGGASATSSVVPFPGAASGNRVSLSLLGGVVAVIFFSL
ncbi:Cell surface Cu-only superoxide dismutase [Trichoderma ghanense]|uniref:Cell surface Cu-only superoxide dismutase n=1 Tax=Trichoderma ghanense TaxID=65468 RepID=A0ABY2GZQ6_9HYPO